jgi:hypothetical protein
MTMITLRCSAALLALAAAGTAWAAPAPASGAQQRYTQDRADCIAGRTQQDRATCLREAGAALAENRRGGLASDPAQFQANQLLRCQGLPDADRSDCIKRMQGQGTTSGSVGAGGIYRELVTIEPAK